MTYRDTPYSLLLISTYICYKCVSCPCSSPMTAHFNLRYFISTNLLVRWTSQRVAPVPCPCGLRWRHGSPAGGARGRSDQCTQSIRSNRRRCCWIWERTEHEKERQRGRVARKEQGNDDRSPSRPCAHEMLREILMRRPSRVVRQSRKPC